MDKDRTAASFSGHRRPRKAACPDGATLVVPEIRVGGGGVAVVRSQEQVSGQTGKNTGETKVKQKQNGGAIPFEA